MLQKLLNFERNNLFQKKVIAETDYEVLNLEGNQDIDNFETLDAKITNVRDARKQLILNLQKVNYLDSTALGVIAKHHYHLREQQRPLKIVCPNQQMRTVFMTYGLTNEGLEILSSVNGLN